MFESRNSNDGLETQLTVAAVSRQIGVPASTLRTWERRYGVGPSARTSGGHRRYSAEDLVHLRRMAELVQKGVPAAEAADVVRARPIVAMASGPVSGAVPIVDVSLVDAIVRHALADDYPAVQKDVKQALAGGPLISGYSNYIAPALDRLRGDAEGNRPGSLPALLLAAGVLEQLAALRERHPLPSHAPHVVVMTDTGRELAGHVLAAVLLSRGVDACVVAAEPVRGVSGSSRYRAHAELTDPSVIVLLQIYPTEDLVAELSHEPIPFIVQSPNPVPAGAGRVTHLRNLSAVADEVTELVAAGRSSDA